jgi:hypothetical protein
MGTLTSSYRSVHRNGDPQPLRRSEVVASSSISSVAFPRIGSSVEPEGT